MLPNTFSGGIGPGSELVGGRTVVRPKTVQKMADASNEWRTLVRCQKPLEMHLQRRKRAELEDFRCSSQENTSENAPDSVFSSWVKSSPPDGFFPLLRIGHKSFDLWGSYSEDFNPHSWHAS
uniref:Uncharacterized protein n=1 Tax=Cucumis melo TaxID=3656 RepID=A0A9I9EK04_CUCME